MLRCRKVDNPYHRMGIAEKQAHHREQMREPAVACPACDTQTTASDLLQHVAERCAGPREPGPGARWISWREAVRQGIKPQTLSKWANNGRVRFRGHRTERQYLLRDLAFRTAQLRLDRRR